MKKSGITSPSERRSPCREPAGNSAHSLKADLCVELLKGEKDLNSLASENSLLPNLLRNWKKDFLEKCSKAFDDTSENYWKEKYLAGHREKEDYARKVGQLAMQVDWLKKKSEETLGPGYEDKFTPKPFEE